ncbi:MAG: HlyD family type I secretion periplasmic adaptor subunit [Pseudomonadota bacterium]
MTPRWLRRGLVLSPTFHLSATALLALLGGLVLIAVLVEVEIVARGQGVVETTLSDQVVQTQIDGTVTEILVRDGDEVRAGQPVLRLDGRSLAVEREAFERQRRETDHHLRRALAFMRAISDPTLRAASALLPATAALDTETRNRERNLLITELAVHDARRAELKAGVQVGEAEVERLRGRVSATASAFALATARHDMAQRLAGSGTISKASLQDSKARLLDTTGARDDAVLELARAEQELAHARHAVEVFRQTTVRDTQVLIQTLRTDRDALAEALDDLTIKEAALTLRAPVHGQVTASAVTALGSRVQAGETVLRIVPAEAELIVVAEFLNSEIGFLAEGQNSYLKFHAFPHTRYEALPGVVTHIAADAERQDESYVYKIMVTPLETTIDSASGPRSILSGMTLDADVVTGTRRLISYFVEPVTDTLSQGLTER